MPAREVRHCRFAVRLRTNFVPPSLPPSAGPSLPPLWLTIGGFVHLAPVSVELATLQVTSQKVMAGASCSCSIQRPEVARTVPSTIYLVFQSKRSELSATATRLALALGSVFKRRAKRSRNVDGEMQKGLV